MTRPIEVQPGWEPGDPTGTGGGGTILPGGGIFDPWPVVTPVTPAAGNPAGGTPAAGNPTGSVKPVRGALGDGTGGTAADNAAPQTAPPQVASGILEWFQSPGLLGIPWGGWILIAGAVGVMVWINWPAAPKRR